MCVWQTLLLPPTSPWANSLETPCRDQSTWRDPLPAPSPSVKLWNESDSLRSLVEVPDRSLGRCQQAPGELAACGRNGKIFPIFLQIWNFITSYPDLQTTQLICSSPSPAALPPTTRPHHLLCSIPGSFPMEYMTH